MTARKYLCQLVHPHRERKSFGDPHMPHTSESARRKVGKSCLVGDRGLWLPELPNFSDRHPVRRRRRGGARPALLLHERRKFSHNTRHEQKTNTAPPKRGRPIEVVWEWWDKKCHAIGNDSSKYELQEIAEQSKISAVSIRNREKVLAEIWHACTAEEWR